MFYPFGLPVSSTRERLLRTKIKRERYVSFNTKSGDVEFTSKRSNHDSTLEKDRVSSGETLKTRIRLGDTVLIFQSRNRTTLIEKTKGP